MVDIYTLINSEKLDFKVFKLLHSQEGFNLGWVVDYFRENEGFLSSVVVNQLQTVFDREEFLHNVKGIRDSLER